MENKPQVYFGACDRQMESFIGRENFRRALVYALLFHGDAVIPDIFLYISSHFADLLLSDGFSGRFIAAGVRNGAIIPAFRRGSNDCFKDNLKQIRLEGIQGVHEKADKVCDALENAIIGKRLHSVLWTEKPMSVGYKMTLDKIFLSDFVPAESPLLERVWDQTRELRPAVLGAIKPDSLGGIRRGELYNSLNAYLNGTNEPVHDIRVIWSGLDEERLELSKRFLKWVNYCYHFNHGTMISLSPSLSSLEPVDVQFARHLAHLEQQSTPAPVVSQAFRLPSIDAILTVDPTTIFGIRDSEFGAKYFAALAAWQKIPSEDTAAILLDALERYTAALTGAYLEDGRSIFNWEWFLKAEVPAGQSPWNEVRKKTAIEVGKEILLDGIPFVGLLSLVGKLAAATYESLPVSAKDKLGPAFGVGKRVRIDVERKMERLTDVDQVTTDASFQHAAA